jgi:hypothetical protein
MEQAVTPGATPGLRALPHGRGSARGYGGRAGRVTGQWSGGGFGWRGEGRVANPPQVGNLPHTQRLAANSTITLDGETVVSIDWRQR